MQVLLRKGGIREGTFQAREDTFLLFPTGFHTDEALLREGAAAPYLESLDWDPKAQPSFPIKSVAQVGCTLVDHGVHSSEIPWVPANFQVTRSTEQRACYMQVQSSFWTHDLRVFEALEELHIWSPAFKAKRLQARQRQPVTALLLRVWNLHQPIELQQDDAFWGCFSWGMV